MAFEYLPQLCLNVFSLIFDWSNSLWHNHNSLADEMHYGGTTLNFHYSRWPVWMFSTVAGSRIFNIFPGCPVVLELFSKWLVDIIMSHFTRLHYLLRDED